MEHLKQVVDWSRNTGDGSLSDLSFKPNSSVWDEVRSEHGNCLGKSCPTYDNCLYYRARRRIWNSDVLVVNHALFFADLALRREGASVLPEYDVVVFDEAHTLEQVDADHLGLSVTGGQVEYLLNRLFNDRTQKGLLTKLPLNDSSSFTLRTSTEFDLSVATCLRISQNGVRAQVLPTADCVNHPILSMKSRHS